MNPVIAGLTSSVTTAVADHAVIAVFGLMAIDALLPVGGELVMLYAGVLAAGAVTGHHATFAGTTVSSGIETYLVLALAGTFGYLLGALIGWAIGRRGGRALIDRRGRWLHLGPERFARAEAWFARWGSWAVFLGRITPLVRSFISIPAGVLGSPLVPYTLLTLLGSAIWCFAFAGAGWALGDSWHSVHDAFRYIDYAVVLAVIGVAAVLVVRLRRRRAVEN
jgi:membrane protein DedA with SNARE-associated domain